MMTLRELEETVDEQGEVMKRSSSTGTSSLRAQVENLHSTQSMTGRQSLLTQDHVQYKSASDALNAYINSFEESHPLQTSSYIYSRTPEDLLLPQSVLSRTVDRSLETGKNDTKEEFHLHNVKRIIDESYNEIIKADMEREQAESVLLSSKLLTRDPSSEVSSLPDPDQAVKMTPLLKSTPIHNYRSVQPSRTASLSKIHSEASEYQTLGKFTPFARSSQKRQKIRSPLKYSGKNKKEIPASVTRNEKVSKTSKLDSLSVSPGAKLSSLKPIQSPAMNDTLLSGGRPPPSWLDELDNSQVTSVSKRKSGIAAEKVANLSSTKFGLRKTDLLNDGIDVESLSSYGIDEVALLKEVEAIMKQRRHERRRKEAEAAWMKKRWQMDRRNESLFEKPTKMKAKPQRTESVTTDDLVTASPYGLDKRLHGYVEKVPLFESDKLRSVTHLQPHRSLNLALRTRKPFLSKSDGSIPERTRGNRENKESASKLLKPPAIRTHHSSGLLTPNMLTKVGQPTGLFLPSPGTKPHANRNYCPSTAPSGHTDSLLLASPFGEVRSQSSVPRKMESSHVFRKKLKAFDDRYSERYPSTLTDTGGGATVGTVGDTSRVDAVISRAQRLMGESENEHQIHFKRSPLNSTNPGSVMDRYLGDCLQVSQQDSEQQRPLESLKQILFTLQDLEEIQTAQIHQSNRPQSKEVQESDELIQMDDMDSDGLNSNSTNSITDECHEEGELKTGGESINKALAHLSRLKHLISEGDTTASVEYTGVT